MTLYEPIPIIDIFCSGLAKVESVGGDCLRLYLYTVQNPLNGDGEPEKVLVAKIVAPMSALPEAITKVLTLASNQFVGLLPRIGELMQ